MSAPTPVVRATTYERDGHRCVSCGSHGPLQYQHRAVDGMGGRAARPKLEEGVTSCAVCNEAYEGRMQAQALRFGWKVPTWVRDRGLAYRVPVYVRHELTWFLLLPEGGRLRVSWPQARAAMCEVYGERAYAEWEAAA